MNLPGSYKMFQDISFYDVETYFCVQQLRQNYINDMDSIELSSLYNMTWNPPKCLHMFIRAILSLHGIAFVYT